MTKENKGIVPVNIGILPDENKALTLDEIIKKMNLTVYGDGEKIEAHPFIKKIIDEKKKICVKGNNIHVEDEISLKEASETKKEINSVAKKIKDGFNYDRDLFFKIHQHLLKIQSDLLEEINDTLDHIGKESSRYNTEKIRKIQEENERKMKEAERARQKLRKEAAEAIKPETKQSKEEIAETIIAPTEELDLTKMVKEIQIKEPEKFLKAILNIKGMYKHISISRTGIIKLIDDMFDIDKCNFVKNLGAYYQGIFRIDGKFSAVIIARKK
jgi:hypothetical protein